MMTHKLTIAMTAILCTLWCGGIACAAPTLRVEGPYCFTDERVKLHTPRATEPLKGRIRVLTDSGWGPEEPFVLAQGTDGAEFTPLCEGLHVVLLEEPFKAEVRFLAMAPPPPLVAAALRKTLPLSGTKLLAGEAYTILAMGDSVMHTGECDRMLAMMLTRATGNAHIKLIKRAYPGRSADAAARFFEDDAIPSRPDLGLLMYGLNDQACFVPLEAYLEHYEYVARRLREDLCADCVFMQPTPSPDPGSPTEHAFRTICFAESLGPLAERMDVPLARTFDAVWGRGGQTLPEAMKAMWPRYPPSYDRQFESLIETGGRGDTVHPNALGHLAMARAVFEALAGHREADALEFSGRTYWTDSGVETHLIAKNTSASHRRGRLEVFPPYEDKLEGHTSVEYDLKPGATAELRFSWPNARTPADLLHHPADKYLADGRPRVPVVDFSEGACRVRAPELPFEPMAAFRRERKVVEGHKVKVLLLEDGRSRTRTVAIPRSSSVGRIDLVEKVRTTGGVSWAVAQLAYVRYGSALRGEAEVDGDLSEWSAHIWSPVGESCQARFVRGHEDYRSDPSECWLEWAFKAGADALYIASRATGDIFRDSFTIFFDRREPHLLGTVGRYYWVSGSVKPDGTLALSRGETSREGQGLAGRHRRTGQQTSLEIRVPYSLFESTSWPDSGDLGVSIWWIHISPDGRRTNLMWSEDGHPWNPRWYGVVRLQTRPNESRLPYMVRVR